MADEAAQSEEFNNAVAQDRATMIREVAKKDKKSAEEEKTKQAVSSATGKISKKALDKLFLNINNIIWGLTAAILPLFGLTLLMSILLILALLLKKFVAGSLEKKGLSVEISFITKIYTWGTLFAQLLLTVIVYSIIYMIINPLDFGLDALGL